MDIAGLDLIVNRTDLNDARLQQAQFPDTPPPGQVLLQVANFALTANTITYAVAPESIGYWNFFPSDVPGTGRIPAWGFADVVASAVPEVPVGTRVYGYVPMSTHFMVTPGEITGRSFTDMAEHRQPMAPIYNQYTLTAADPAYEPAHEALISLFRPLFTTSFLLNVLHQEQAYFGAAQVLLSSASSKTAMSLAHLLQSEAPEGTEVVGLTSAGNVDFVAALGCYDRVVAYDAVATLPDTPAAFVDMAGNTDVLRAVHAHFGDGLKNSCRVGLTHWQNTAPVVEDLPGPKPEWFFAPGYAQEKVQAWGRAEFHTRLGAAWQAFARQGAEWVNVTNYAGPEAARARYLATLNGDIDPAQGQILTLLET